MRWQDGRRSDNVADRRGDAGKRVTGRRRLRLPAGKGGLILLAAVMVAGYFSADLTGLLTGKPVSPPPALQTYRAGKDDAAEFTAMILASTGETWRELFARMGRTYQQPKLVMYRGAFPTGCGADRRVMGGMYCPDDGTVYIDLSFYDEMKNASAAGRDFLQGYVVAHEVGRHVQTLLGIDARVRQLQKNASQAEANRLSVCMAQQAECFAGVWGYSMRQQGVLEAGDLETMLHTVGAVDDSQQQSQSSMVAESVTSGVGEQRYSWFRQGFDSGDPRQCNTFGKTL